MEPAEKSPSPVIDCDFPGGNIVLDRMTGDDICLHQDLRDTGGDWFYWYFRVRHASNKRLCFHFTESRALGVRGAALSLDKGTTWRWLGSGTVEEDRFFYDFPPNIEEARFSFGMPYLGSHWTAFAHRWRNSTRFANDEFCPTEKGRTSEAAHLYCSSGVTRFRVVVTCRHHCCEMMANYVLEGLIEHILRAEDETGEWLRNNVEFLMLPFMDKDGVEQGDQGKNRRPHDHNRDYLGEKSIYATTIALQKLLPTWSNGLLRVALDLHCPHISGLHNEDVFLVGSPCDRIRAHEIRFSNILESIHPVSLPFEARHYMPFGTSWNKRKTGDDGICFSHWAGLLPEITLATSIEIPYANAGGVEVNAESSRGFGKDIARALCIYLKMTDAQRANKTTALS